VLTFKGESKGGRGMVNFLRPEGYWIDGLKDLCTFMKIRGFREGGKFVEIGCYMGESTEVFSNELGGVIAIEPFRVREGAGGSTTEDWHDDLMGAEIEFWELMERCAGIELKKGFDWEFLNEFKDGELEGVYIDAVHTYEAVKKNIIDWMPKVRVGGFISGHDYGNDPTPGVKQAVDEIFGKPDFTCVDYSWVVQKRVKSS